MPHRLVRHIYKFRLGHFFSIKFVFACYFISLLYRTLLYRSYLTPMLQQSLHSYVTNSLYSRILQEVSSRMYKGLIYALGDLLGDRNTLPRPFFPTREQRRDKSHRLLWLLSRLLTIVAPLFCFWGAFRF
jgi:hypothetical protein